MRKTLVLAGAALAFVASLQAQPRKAPAKSAPAKPAAAPAPVLDPVLLTIGGKSITKSEFVSIYKKNSGRDKDKEKLSLQDYLQLFVNFKLQVRDAEAMGLDTTPAFKNELEGYRKQLAQPYLVDNEVNEQLLKEAYERMKTEIHVAHILVKTSDDALPKDTLKAYNQAIEYRNMLLKGDDFAALAKRVSTDPSAKDGNGNKGNGGDLGYFSALQFVYPFENACFNMNPGEISMPVRTKFGYHIIKVIDKRNSLGQITVAHIMVKCPKGTTGADSANAYKRIVELQDSVKQGKDFAKLAERYSDDKGSARKGGELPMFGSGRMVPEFEKAAFALTADGQISAPVLTDYGWHLIKRVSKKGIGTFDELKAELKAKVNKDSRSQKSRESMISKIKKEYGFKEMAAARNEFIPLIDSTFFQGKWKASAAEKLKKPLFTIKDKTYTQTDFAKFLEARQVQRPKVEPTVVINEQYKTFVTESCLSYEEGQLLGKYPDYRALYQEYRDGILLFDVKDKKVWSKGVKDTTGLKNFYESHKENYRWDERVDANIFRCKSDSVAKAVVELLNPPAAPKKKKKKGEEEPKPLILDDVISRINAKSKLNLNVESGKFSKGENEWVDKVGKTVGITAPVKADNGMYVFVRVNAVIPPGVKSLNEARGLITADYQNQLEKEWLESLRVSYPVEVKQEVLSTIP